MVPILITIIKAILAELQCLTGVIIYLNIFRFSSGRKNIKEYSRISDKKSVKSFPFTPRKKRT